MVLENAHTLPLMRSEPDPTPLACEDLRMTTVPVLVIYGEETLPLLQFASKAVAACIPDAQLSALEGVGHIGPVVAKDAFLKLVLDFVDAR
jgi:pimeloyl-ACP methyl ester carboxylesterase